MKKTIQFLITLIGFALGSASVHAAVKYWDIDGITNPGAGGATPSGTWDTGTTANWTQDSTGSSAAETWATSDSAVFSAGTDAIDPFTVTVSGNQTATGITFEEGTVTLSGGTITLGVGAVPVVATVSGTINSVLDIGGLTKTGTGTLTLNGANTYTNTTTVSAGVIAVGNANALGNAGAAPANTVVSSGAAIEISGGVALAEALSAPSPATGVGSAGVVHSLSGSNSVDFINITGSAGSSARINIDSGTLFVRAIYAPNRNLLTLGGDGNTIISSPTAVTNVDGCLWGGEGGGITKEGTGTVTLNGQFSNRGTVNVSAGTFIMGASGRFGNAGPVLPDLAVTGVFDVNGFDNAVDGLYGAGSVINAGTSTLVICTNGSVAGTHNAAPDFTGVISGGTTIVKGNGATRTQTFSGANTYTGNTIIKVGTLKLGAAGSISNSPAIDVQSGATFDVSSVTGGFVLGANQTLMGNGTVAGPVTVAAGGRVSPGASAGKLTVTGGLDLSAGGTNIWELAANDVTNPGTNFDQIVLTGGTLALGGSSTLSINFTGTATAPVGSDPFWQSVRTWNIIAASGAASNFATVENGSYAAGNFTTSVDGSGIVLTFTPTAVPPGATPPVITSVVDAGTASVTVNYTNTLTGTNYVLRYSTNLSVTNWYDVGTKAATGPSDFQTDTPAVGDPQRYYRVYYATP